jgi:hypothetical protein
MRQWSEKDIKVLRKNSGKLRVSALAKKLRRSPNAIRVKASQLKIPLSAFADKWSQVEKTQVVALRSEGLTWKEISERLLRSEDSCRKMFQRLEGSLTDVKNNATLKEYEDLLKQHKYDKILNPQQYAQITGFLRVVLFD